jgi:hypothetical protein
MSESDPEIAALTTLIKILDPLNNDQRIRVLSFNARDRCDVVQAGTD